MKTIGVAAGLLAALLSTAPASSATAASLATGRPDAIRALADQLSAVIGSLPADAPEAVFEAQLAAALDGGGQTCTTAAAAVRTAQGAAAPAHARQALVALGRAVALCGGTGAIGRRGPLALGAGPDLGGGGGSDYIR